MVCFLSFGIVIEDSHRSAARHGGRIPRPKIDKLACQEKGVGIFDARRIPLCSYHHSMVCFLSFGIVIEDSHHSAARHGVRIPRPKIDKLACQEKGVGIFDARRIPLFHDHHPRVCFLSFGSRIVALNHSAARHGVRIPRPKIDKLACQEQVVGASLPRKISPEHPTWQLLLN